MTITQLNAEDRPREKFMRCGPEALSTAELLAILVGSGTTGLTAVQLMQKLLSAYGDKLRLLGRATMEELTNSTEELRDERTGERHVVKRFPGLGEAKAITVLAACELCRRRQLEEIPARMTITCSQDTYTFMRPRVEDLATEHFFVLCLNNQQQLIKYECLSKGGLTSTIVDVRGLMRVALINEATSIIVCHNHPSGSLRPSRHDDQITHDIQQACAALGIHLHDHLIISQQGFYSYCDQGKL